MNFTIFSITTFCFVALAKAIEFEITQGWTENGKMVLQSDKLDFDHPICPSIVSHDTFIRLDSSESAHNLSIMTPSISYENKGKFDRVPKLNFWEFDSLKDDLMSLVHSGKSIELQPGQSLFKNLMEAETKALFVGATVSDDAAATLYMGSPHPEAYFLLFQNNSVTLEVIRSIDFDKQDIHRSLFRKLDVGSTLLLTNFFNAHEIAGDAAYMLLNQVKDRTQCSYTQAFVELFNHDARAYERNPFALSVYSHLRIANGGGAVHNMTSVMTIAQSSVDDMKKETDRLIDYIQERLDHSDYSINAMKNSERGKALMEHGQM